MTMTFENQKSVKINVSYYDETEKELLRQYPSSKQIEELVNNGIEIPMAEFLTYYWLYNKLSGAPEWADYKTIYKDIEKDISKATFNFRGLIGCNGQSICGLVDPSGLHKNNDLKEHIGEAAGLSLVSRIHGLTDMDWVPIKEEPVKTLDFRYNIASTGSEFIEVENKGSCVDDNSHLSDPIYSHKASIKEKKEDINRRILANNYPDPDSLRYGTIAAFDKTHDMKCWILDPSSDRPQYDPHNFRLLTRMRFLRNWISFIAPLSQLTSALSTRVADLQNLSDPFELDGIKLLRRNEKPFNFSSSPFDQQSTFWSHRAHIVDGPAGGIILQISDNELFLTGIREDLLILASEQNFKEIMNYKTYCGTISKTVECVFSGGRYKALHLPQNVLERTTKTGNYYSFKLSGKIHYSLSGLVFGILPMNTI